MNLLAKDIDRPAIGIVGGVGNELIVEGEVRRGGWRVVIIGFKSLLEPRMWQLSIADKDAQLVPRSMNLIHFVVLGPGEIVATDNGGPTDMTAFPSRDRKAFNGLALVIVRAKRGQSGQILVKAKSEGLEEASVRITVK